MDSTSLLAVLGERGANSFVVLDAKKQELEWPFRNDGSVRWSNTNDHVNHRSHILNATSELAPSSSALRRFATLRHQIPLQVLAAGQVQGTARGWKSGKWEILFPPATLARAHGRLLSALWRETPIRGLHAVFGLE